jgi:hypothetical protein
MLSFACLVVLDGDQKQERMVFSRPSISFSDKKQETLNKTDCKRNYIRIIE